MIKRYLSLSPLYRACKVWCLDPWDCGISDVFESCTQRSTYGALATRSYRLLATTTHRDMTSAVQRKPRDVSHRVDHRVAIVSLSCRYRVAHTDPPFHRSAVGSWSILQYRDHKAPPHDRLCGQGRRNTGRCHPSLSNQWPSCGRCDLREHTRERAAKAASSDKVTGNK